MCYEPELDPIFDPEELQHNAAFVHMVRVEPVMFFEEDDGSEARCSCGWRGRARFIEEDADKDAERHLREVRGERVDILL